MRKKLRSLAPALLIAVVAATPAHAASGSVDPAFGVGGEAQAALPGGTTVLTGGLFEQADGRIVAAGTHNTGGGFTTPSQSSTVLTRFTRSGVQDLGYGDDGWLVDDRFETTGRPVAGPADTVVLPAGKIGANPTATAWVARYTADGDRDKRFGDDGAIKLPLPPEGFWGARRIAVDRDGSMYVAFFGANQAVGDRYGIVHVEGDGTIDRAFGDDGIVLSDKSEHRLPGPLVIAPDGGIVMASTKSEDVRTPTFGGLLPDIVLVRYDRHGQIDTGFGADGSVDTGIHADPADLVVDRTGKLSLVTPSVTPPFPRQALVERFDARGVPDGDFAKDGVFKIGIGSSVDPVGAAVQTDGKLVVAGAFSQAPTNPQANSAQAGWTIFRVGTTGRLDKTFGDKGVVNSARGPAFTQATGVAIEDDGDVVVGGTANGCEGGASMTLVRFVGDDDGKPDPGPLVSTCPGTLPVEDGEIPVVIACPLIEETCDGDVVVDQYLEGAKRRRAGKARFRMRGNQARAANVKLSSGARAFARSHARFKVLVTITARDADGHRRVIKRRLNVAR